MRVDGILVWQVAGIYDKPPNEEGAKLIPRISARGDAKSNIKTCEYFSGKYGLMQPDRA